VDWRARLAETGWGRLGIGAPHGAARFRLLIDDAGPNLDLLGHVGRTRAGACWDPATRTYQSGQSTPAHEILRRYGAAALVRFDTEGVRGTCCATSSRCPTAPG
jgi:hypothetical protein